MVGVECGLSEHSREASAVALAQVRPNRQGGAADPEAEADQGGRQGQD